MKCNHLLISVTIQCLLLLIGHRNIQAQDRHQSLMFETQVYPTGLLPGLRFEHYLSKKDAIHIRWAYQLIDHRDLGKHESEKGNGLGFTLGYTRFFNLSQKGFSIGIRNDIWWNTIDWKDNIDIGSEISGTTKITVLQPTVLLEYRVDLGNSFILIPSAGFGIEWNIKTNGEPTGEGVIGLLGISIGKYW